jgi:hypothetical protein
MMTVNPVGCQKASLQKGKNSLKDRARLVSPLWSAQSGRTLY